MDNAELGDIDRRERRIRIVLCGIGGYGQQYVRTLRDGSRFCGHELVAAIDPLAKLSPEYETLQRLGVPIFSELDEFFARAACDLVIVCSPIQFHRDQTCLALVHGAHVLCEKPLCSSREDADEMAQAEQASGCTVSIGYQWSFSQGIERLKMDVLQGKLGRPLLLKTLVCWPRGNRYYSRNQWAGRIHDDAGRMILDSPVNNATAHFLHNMFYLMGSTPESSAWPVEVKAQLCRANAIENYDTAALEIRTDIGVKMAFFSSHATRDLVGPRFTYEFEDAVVSYEMGELVVHFHDGRVIHYPSPEAEPEPETKLRAAIELVRNGGVSRCGISASRAHMECTLLAQSAASEIRNVPESMIVRRQENGEERLYVDGLQEALTACFDSGRILHLDQLLESVSLEQRMVCPGLGSGAFL